MTNDINIHFFIGSLRGGGAEKVCVNLANRLSELDYNVTLIVLNLKDAVYEKQINSNIRLINLNVNHTRNSMYRIYKLLKLEQPKILLTFNHQLSIMLVVIRKLFKMKYKVISRNIIMLSEAKGEKESFWHKHIVYAAIKLLYNKVDCIISQSEMMREDLMENFNIKPSKVVVINNPISKEIEKKSQLLNLEVPQIQNKNILFVGRLARQKGLDYLLDAFSKVVDKDNEISLTIVGEGPLKGWIEENINKLDLKSNIIIKGFTNQIIQEYESSNVVVLSSRFEGFPNVLVEAISLGIPIVSFDCPSGPREIIQSNINGYLVEYKNSEELAKKILESLRTKWDRKAIVTTSKKFSSYNIISQYDELIKKL